jgi:hypothetical protein
VRDIDPAYSNLVSGKRVAVVGPARTLIGKRQGQHIDSHDLVVRFNDTFGLPSRPELVADIGSRTDVLYCNQVILRHALASGVSWKGLAYVICTNNSLSFTIAGRPEPTCDRQDRRVIARFADELTRQKSTTRWRVVRAASEELSRRLHGQWPRTGLVGIVDLLSFGVRRLFITGMTFYHGGGHLLMPESHELHPRHNRDGTWAQSPSGLGHDSYLELEVMKALAQEYSGVLEVDDTLAALIKG